MDKNLALCIFAARAWCDPFNLVQQALEFSVDLVDLAPDLFLSGALITPEYSPGYSPRS